MRKLMVWAALAVWLMAADCPEEYLQAREECHVVLALARTVTDTLIVLRSTPPNAPGEMERTCFQLLGAPRKEFGKRPTSTVPLKAEK